MKCRKSEREKKRGEKHPEFHFAYWVFLKIDLALVIKRGQGRRQEGKNPRAATLEPNQNTKPHIPKP